MIAREITSNQVQQLPKKSLLSSESLVVKYVVLNRISVTNWAPTNHSSSITSVLTKLIFQIGTKSKLNFGEHVFDQTMKLADSYVVKLPIAFHCLITGIILKQHHNIMHADKIKSKNQGPLTLYYMLLLEHMSHTLWC